MLPGFNDVPFICIPQSTSRDEKRRAAIFSGLLLANEDAWASLLQVTDVESAQKVASSLVRLFAAEGQDLKLVKYCIMKDVADTRTVLLLFDRVICVARAANPCLVRT